MEAVMVNPGVSDAPEHEEEPEEVVTLGNGEALRKSWVLLHSRTSDKETGARGDLV